MGGGKKETLRDVIKRVRRDERSGSVCPSITEIGVSSAVCSEKKVFKHPLGASSFRHAALGARCDAWAGSLGHRPCVLLTRSCA